MAVKKSTFFVALFVILILPFLLHNFFWIVMSREINGSMRYVGKSNSGQLSKEFSVIRFFIEKDTVWFNGMDNYFFKKDEVVPVRYQVNEPVDARINSFVGLWGDTIMYITPLLLIMVICFFHPDLFPSGSKIQLFGKSPFIRIIE